MAFEIIGSEVIATELMGGVTMDALVASTVAAAGEGALAAEATGVVADGLAAEPGAAGVSGATGTAGGAAETVGAGPSVAADAAESQTEKLANQILQGAPDTGSGASTAQTAQAEQSVIDGANAGPTTKPGLVDRAVAWAEKNPTLAAVGGTTVAGAVGGAGKAALESEIAKRNIKARQDLLNQQFALTQQQSRGGALPGSVGVGPSGRRTLLRPDGTAVYAPGIVNNQIIP